MCIRDSVTDEKSLETGADVRVGQEGDCERLEVDRFLEPTSAWNTPQTSIWFRAGAGCTYFLYYDNSRAGDPPEDPANVFMLWDGFDGEALDTTWHLDAIGGATMESAVPMAGKLRLSGTTGDIGSTTDSMVLVSRSVTGDFVFDVYVTGSGGSIGGAAKMGGAMVRQSTLPEARHATISLVNTPRARAHVQRVVDGGDSEVTDIMSMEQFPELFSAQRVGGEVATLYSDDGHTFVALGVPASLGIQDPVLAGVPFANISGGAGWIEVDWVRMRAVQVPPVNASLGDEQSL